jgi:hypothetical protein
MRKHKKSKHRLAPLCLPESIPTASPYWKTGERYGHGVRLFIHKLDVVLPDNSPLFLYMAQCKYSGMIYPEVRPMDDPLDIKRFELRALHHFKKIVPHFKWEKVHHCEQGRPDTLASDLRAAVREPKEARVYRSRSHQVTKKGR